YIPGLLTFREAPILLQAFRKIKIYPDVVLFDGQGIAHPRRFGLASHMGLLLDLPAVGCAKTLLIGKAGPVGKKAGSFSYLQNNGEVIGAVLRTRSNIKPVFISPGHKITLDECINIVLKCIHHYRLPEPTRQAHILVNKFRMDDPL
ncbi:MAG: endonuclease V, partial [Thermodesulfobacteriota bacterium]|nr:endonuclease V [Thermodesulfobacteriota bacterium]